MGSVKGKCIDKYQRKRIVKSFYSWAKDGYIFRQRSVAEYVRKVTLKKECRMEMLFKVK
jgi:hypothetical protein